MFQIVSSVRESAIHFHKNLCYLKNGLSNGEIHFQGIFHHDEPPAFVYDNKTRVYDFTRTAQANVRDDMARRLRGWLRGLPTEQSREVFDYLFDYHHYKEYLNVVGKQRAESMKMLIFRRPDRVNQGYVALVQFSCTSKRHSDILYTVNATLTCERFSYFELQEGSVDQLVEQLVREVENLRLAQRVTSDSATQTEWTRLK